MFWKRKDKEPKKSKTITLQKFQPIFTTTDNIEHEGIDTKWVNADGLICSVPEYLMINIIKSDGYMKDKNDVMYPMQNIRSIEWKLLGEKVVLDNFCHNYQIFFSNKEVIKMTEYKEINE